MSPINAVLIERFLIFFISCWFGSPLQENIANEGKEIQNQFRPTPSTFWNSLSRRWKTVNLDKLNALKNKGKYTFQQISNLTNIPLSTLNRIFKGESSPTFDNIATIVRAIGGDLNDLADLQNSRSSEEMLDFLMKSLEEKRRVIRILAITCGIMVSVFIFIVLFDITNGGVGYVRY